MVFPSCPLRLRLQSLLCGPSLSVGSVTPLLERLSEETLWGFSLHLLCATRRGQYSSSIEQLLDRCPQAIIAYANHQLQDKHMVCDGSSVPLMRAVFFRICVSLLPLLLPGALVAEAAP